MRFNFLMSLLLSVFLIGCGSDETPQNQEDNATADTVENADGNERRVVDTSEREIADDGESADKDFTQQSELSTAELTQLMDQSDVVLLDSREKDEYEVSHIENSIWVGYETFDMKNVPKIKDGEKVVVYCSVGARSGEISNQLKEAGYDPVWNYDGGIFHWHNSGKPVVNEKGVTDSIHGYNAVWGKMIKRGTVVYEP